MMKYNVAVTAEGTRVWPQMRMMRPYSRITMVRKPTHSMAASDMLDSAGGADSFRGSTAPLECAAKVYSSGEEVPFTIKVANTATTTAPDGTILASQITARYINTSRLNRTPCVIVLGHDAARYTGVDVTH